MEIEQHNLDNQIISEDPGRVIRKYFEIMKIKT